ncbi:helix-turn-helix domain-containing protein [Metabacillus sp. KIGAM252]|uniref:Helix-turn-helix domain-containing protein n=1 Tax=Metabacillus flavus TaxID=2823519 RepID=A0ABS5LEB4_9BACI|nr:helix-turn-helix domain-containing protein [Metabacillus flavus]
MKVKKPSDHISYMFKIHPNHVQQQLINQTFGCVRFVYNTILHHNLNESKLNSF